MGESFWLFLRALMDGIGFCRQPHQQCNSAEYLKREKQRRLTVCVSSSSGWTLVGQTHVFNIFMELFYLRDWIESAFMNGPYRLVRQWSVLCSPVFSIIVITLQHTNGTTAYLLCAYLTPSKHRLSRVSFMCGLLYCVPLRNNFTLLLAPAILWSLTKPLLHLWNL